MPFPLNQFIYCKLFSLSTVLINFFKVLKYLGFNFLPAIRGVAGQNGLPESCFASKNFDNFFFQIHDLDLKATHVSQDDTAQNFRVQLFKASLV